MGATAIRRTRICFWTGRSQATLAAFSKWPIPGYIGSWGFLTEALKTGRNQNEAKESGDVFAALYADPDRLRGFLAAMSGASLGAAQAIAAKFPWQDYKSFVDIGTAQGMLAVTIARGHNHLSGAGYDLPEVKPIFEEFIAQHGMQERVKFLSGNFLTDSLPTADVLIMGHILHDTGPDSMVIAIK
jgi:hypothetical protein